MKAVLLWQLVLPTDVVVDDLLVLDNGDCVAVGLKKTIQMQNQYLHFICINENGNVIQADSLLLPVAIPIFNLTSVNMLQAKNGNLVFYGSYNDNEASKGYLCEYDMSLNPIWVKSFTVPQQEYSVTGCALTPDGGYLVAGHISNFNNQGLIELPRIESNIYVDINAVLEFKF
jgi:hypothetical protein